MSPRLLRRNTAQEAACTGVAPPPAIRLGLGANWRQFTLLVLVNAFVGGMVGLERAVLPLVARQDLVKAGANYAAGRLADRIGRRRVLLLGWLAALPVPLMIIFAPTWGWVVAANVLLGINQGLAWSTTVNMKIDLVGPARAASVLCNNWQHRADGALTEQY
jgi:MFS family permease